MMSRSACRSFSFCFFASNFFFCSYCAAKAAYRFHEEKVIIKSLKHIRASITSLERKYEDIQLKVTENKAEMACKLNEIQATTTRLKTNTNLWNAQSRKHPKPMQISSRPRRPTRRKKSLQCATDNNTTLSAKNAQNTKLH